ncbi:MAG: zinc ribbon domain-containing protein [Planctomycetota bacterium]|jgi:putative FmdB family regulatory protein|nr:zinc ribbon domain-containing protein [Planctomycetota bacterium]MDP7129098.1 zinc ribbon domain-containing protein [Planctomycetota bacterium]MDP7248370.1 zinc ribbon domain-containing protein [Planctomycetota bacterium]|tara:strand:+ start:94 stop:447 length:354 start_codon:yes stop_codon:yes gene_type:complete
MPTYDYECQIEECGHTFEAFQSISARPLRKCPECGGKVKRLIGAGAGLIFKGSGFYITDYRSKEYTEKANADKPSSDSSSSDSKSDSSDSQSDSQKSDSKKSDTGKKDSGKKAKAKS